MSSNEPKKAMKIISEKKNFKAEIELRKDQEIIDNDYNEKISKLVRFINENNFSRIEKLRIIYEYLVNNCEIEWDYIKYMDSDNKNTGHIAYNYKGLKNSYGITGIVHVGSKYAPILIGKGVCTGFSVAFKDIADKVNLKVDTVTGRHFGFGHTWIAVYMPEPENAYKFIDVYQGIADKGNGLSSDLAFLMRESDLSKKGYSEYNNDLNVLKARSFKIIDSTPSKKI